MNHIIDEFLMVSGAFLLGTHIQAWADGKPDPAWMWFGSIFAIASGVVMALSN